MRAIPWLAFLISLVAAPVWAQDCGSQPDPSANNPPGANPDSAQTGQNDGLGNILGDGLSLWWDPLTRWGSAGGSDAPPGPDADGGTCDLSQLLPSPPPGPWVEGPGEPVTPVFYFWTLAVLMHLVDPLVPPEDFAWEAEAEPTVYKRTGIRSFYVDETGILLGNDISPASSSPLPEI